MQIMRILIVLLLVVLPFTLQAQHTVQADDKLPDYAQVSLPNARLRSTGSSTLSNLFNRWSDEFKRIHPNVEFEITGGGSSLGPTALLEGRADLAPMSRAMNEKEIASFQKKFGYPPLELTVGVDAIAVYVHKNNPITSLSLTQLDAMFSLTHKRGGAAVKRWGELGMSGALVNSEIVLRGPANTTGIYNVFRDEVLQDGTYRYDMTAEPVASAIVQSIGVNEAAVGFASYFYATARTRVVPISTVVGVPMAPSPESVLDDSYPLSRKLYVYLNRKPDTALPAQLAAFMQYICSKQGQQSAANDGNYPLNAAIAQKECLELLR